MAGNLLSARNRSFSQASIRKRMIRSSSQTHSQRDLVRNATMSSFKPKLERLIHQGKIQQILNIDRHSKANLIYSSHINDMQKELADSKKDLSSMVLKAKTKQFNINKLKNQLGRLQRQIKIIREKNQKVNKHYEVALDTLQSKKNSKEVAEWTEKSYLHMKQRLLKDQYYYKVRYQNLQKILQAQKHHFKFIQRKYHQVNNHGKSYQQALRQAQQISQAQTYQKNEFIDLVNQQRQQKQFLHDLRVDKQRKQGQIKELSAWVIQKQDLNKYLNILYTHRVLSQIIRSKNNNLMKKYQKVQKAFLHIKSNTNIIEFERVLKKMQQQDSIYDITVKKVSDLQFQLEKMEQQIKNARKQRYQILSQDGKLINHDKNYYQGIQKDNYQILSSQKEKKQHRLLQDEILRQRIIDWAKRLGNNLAIPQQLTPEALIQLCVLKIVQKHKKTQPNKSSTRVPSKVQ